MNTEVREVEGLRVGERALISKRVRESECTREGTIK